DHSPEPPSMDHRRPSDCTTFGSGRRMKEDAMNKKGIALRAAAELFVLGGTAAGLLSVGPAASQAGSSHAERDPLLVGRGDAHDGIDQRMECTLSTFHPGE